MVCIVHERPNAINALLRSFCTHRLAKGALAKRSELTFTLCPFPGRMSKQQRRLAPEPGPPGRPVSGIQRLPGPTLWRKPQPKEHREPGSTAAAIGHRCAQVQPPCAPSCTLPRNSRRKAVKQSLPAPENLRALLEAMLNPLQHTPGTFIREAAEPSEAAFTGDCAFCLPSQRRTKHQTVLAASWRRRSTRDSARPGVL